MHELILHHYAGSPFSEKVRLALGFKGLAWRSVTVPVMMPKPDVIALTGGYRKTPFLQIGADVYCDSALMCKVLERLQPAPTLYPAATAGLAEVVAQWADSALFWSAVPFTLQTGGAHVFPDAPPEFMKAFAADRAGFTAGMRRSAAHDTGAQLVTHLRRLVSMLAGGQPFLLGKEPSIADFAAAQSIWFMRLAPPVAAILDDFPGVTDWYDRVAAFAPARGAKLGADEAIAIAAAAAGTHEPVVVQPGAGFAAGDAVTVNATDYGADPVAGTVVGLDGERVTLKRHDERAGCVHVHFPRVGFQIHKQKQETPA